MKFVNVAFPLNVPQFYTYNNNCNASLGSIVQAKLRGKTRFGLVIETKAEVNLSSVLDMECNTGLALSNETVQWLIKASEYNLQSIHQFLTLTLAECSNIHDAPYYINSAEGPESVGQAIIRLGKREFAKQFKSGAIIKSDFTYSSQINLNESQKAVLQSINHATLRPTLLQGATGIGKTNAYLDFITTYLAKKKQVLILLPEVALTKIFANTIQVNLGCCVHIWTHKTNAYAKELIWNWAHSGEAGLIVGSRSALWLPYKNLGCIVIDEEHDTSYKQENSPRYHARDMAILRCKYEHAKCLLVSATPSLETWHNVQSNKYDLAHLKGEKQKLSLYIADRSSQEWLSQRLGTEITTTLESNAQVMLFLNRKGLANRIQCNQCLNYALCDYCSTGLVFYKSEYGRCSYCGSWKSINSCANCKAKSWSLYGVGIERIAEEIEKLYPHKVAAIISSDINDIDALIERIYCGSIDIIITTQVLAKGYTFPNLTLVGILDCDQGPGFGDPRLNEKLYQLITQVKGRCGRTGLPSTVILQTRNPEDILWSYIKNGDYAKWAEYELEMRRSMSLPPFTRLIRIMTSSNYAQYSQNDINVIYDRIRTLTICTIYPPSPAPLLRHKARFRHSILITYPNNVYPQKNILAILSQIKLPSRSQITIDVDPYSFF